MGGVGLQFARRMFHHQRVALATMSVSLASGLPLCTNIAILLLFAGSFNNEIDFPDDKIIPSNDKMR
jgi:hypothetical protein